MDIIFILFVCGIMIWYSVQLHRDYVKRLMILYELLEKEDFPDRAAFVKIARKVSPIRKKVLSRKYKIKG